MRCLRCGRCCREKVQIEGVVFYTDRVCKFWDARTKLCTVFARRRTACPNCADLSGAIRQGLLPRDCPFVRDLEGYDGPVEHWEDPELEALLAQLPEDPFTRFHPRKRLVTKAGKSRHVRRAPPKGETRAKREARRGRRTKPGREARPGRRTKPGRETRRGRRTESARAAKRGAARRRN